MIRHSRSGFTLIEILTVVIIIAVLALLSIGVVDQFKSRAERVNCSQNLRNLYAGLQSYIVQQGRWPQCPYKVAEPGFDDWWINELGKVSIAEKQWQCPTHVRMQNEAIAREARGGDTKPKRELHYLPTQFDDNPTTPRRWPTQPWLIETGSFHGDGALIIFPDGSIQSFDQFQRQMRR